MGIETSFFYLQNKLVCFFLRSNSSDKIIIHTSNSIATSVKLYERHKLIAEELFKLKQARIHDNYVKFQERLINQKNIYSFEFLDCY